ncbi:leucine Rich Repeat family protein [Aphelenchoides avenae]|nr:leucine Rich Repeat family protein [Aphelenchus avenae]
MSLRGAQVLQVLDLSNNCLTAVPAQNIRNSLKLTTLDLSGNEIGELQRLQFMNLPALKELRLDNNRLTKLSPMAFMNVPELSHLSLSGNQLAGIDPGALQAFKNLQLIDLSGNAITQIPSFKQLLHLRQVRLDNNRIERVETLTFSENPTLQLISLRDNRISLIARNSFDALDQLSIRGMFDGMRNLKELHLETNSIREIYNNSLTSIPQLSVLDLSANKLQKIRSGTFAPLQRLYWLDLSQNDITTVENGAFSRGVGNILLDGNPLSCDAELDWFVSYLVRNQVRTFLPQQPDVTCASPAERAGARLKELMMHKANETRSLIEVTPAPMAPGDIIGNFFGLPPSTAPPRQLLPGRLMHPVSQSQPSGACAPPTPEQVAQWVRTLPSFVVNVPGWGNVDISKLPPGIIEHVLRGGQINGVPSQALRAVVDQFKTYYAQACPQPVPQPVFTTAFEPPTLPSVDFASVKTNASENGTMTEVLSPKVLRMLKLIPPGYNLSRLPPEVMQSVLRGDMPDLRLLPSDLLSYLRDHIDDLIIAFGPIGPDSPTIEDLLGKLPKFEQPALPTFSPYDINNIGSELVIKESDEIYKTRLYTAVALGLVGAVTLAILAIFCAYVKKERSAAAIQAHASTISHEGTRTTPPKRSTSTIQRPPAHPPPPLPPSSTLRKTHLPAPSSAASTMRGFAPSSFEDTAYQRPFTTASGDPFRYAV